MSERARARRRQRARETESERDRETARQRDSATERQRWDYPSLVFSPSARLYPFLPLDSPSSLRRTPGQALAGVTCLCLSLSLRFCLRRRLRLCLCLCLCLLLCLQLYSSLRASPGLGPLPDGLQQLHRCDGQPASPNLLTKQL